MSNAQASDKGAAFTGLIVTAVAIFLMIFGVVKWTNGKFASREGAAGETKAETTH